MTPWKNVWPSAVAWQRMSPTLVLIALLLLVFRDTAAAMVAIWDRSDTFAHAFLVPPIAIWLVWRRREFLATLPVRAQPILLLPLLALCLMWLLGELASVNALTQFALVAMIVLAVPLTLGWTLTRALTFPLLFLFFCVPVGEFMVPQMMDWTADFTVAAIRLSGVPIYREGLQFVIPSGSWSVVEACSGVRYLIASLMVGTLFAYLNFQSTRRRVIFMLASLLMPILANWVRAYLIVMIGHLSNNQLAAGVDHIIYGWVFFGVVIGLMFMVGARFAEPDPVVDSARPPELGSLPIQRLNSVNWPTLTAAAGVILACHAVLWQLNRDAEGPTPVLSLPANAISGWAAAPVAVSDWRPAFANASAEAVQPYTSSDGTVGVQISYYRNQGYQRKLVTSTNALVEAENAGRWAQVRAGGVSVQGPSGPMAVRTAELRGSPHPGTPTTDRLRVWQIYWIDGAWTSSGVQARARLAFSRLLGRGDDGAAVFIYTPIATDGGVDAADALLGRFAQPAWPAIQQALEAAQKQR